MRVEYNDDGTVKGLVVSRRNIITMLAKLNGSPEDSARTIMAPNVEGRDPFYLKAEEDAEHYFGPARTESGAHEGAGLMHPDTEARMELEPLTPDDRLALDVELSSMLKRDDTALD